MIETTVHWNTLSQIIHTHSLYSLICQRFDADHISELWGTTCHLLYPPCSVEKFSDLSSTRSNPTEEFRIVSLAQFRPEKDHMMQLAALRALQKNVTPEEFKKVKLVLIGSCRHEEDVERRVWLLEDIPIISRIQFIMSFSRGSLSPIVQPLLNLHIINRTTLCSVVEDIGFINVFQYIDVCLKYHFSFRVEDLKVQVFLFELKDNVEFLVDVQFSELKDEMAKATAAIHTMWNEHFGIAVVECLAAGLITVAHHSGGPRADIVQPGCGFTASTPEEYGKIFAQIMR